MKPLTTSQHAMTASSNCADDARVYTVIAAIPVGQVASYGDVAKLAGCRNQARWVGRLLSQLPSGSKLPWWRVVNTQGRITCLNSTLARKKLQLEGVPVNDSRIDMRVYRWRPEQ